MKVYWNDCGRGVPFDAPEDVDLEAAGLIWTDEVHGVEGNFLGLIDDQDRTIQFFFDESIPDDIDDAGDLKIVLMDFPIPERKGSYSTHVRIDDVRDLLEKAFKTGADFRKFGDVEFTPW